MAPLLERINGDRDLSASSTFEFDVYLTILVISSIALLMMCASCCRKRIQKEDSKMIEAKSTDVVSAKPDTPPDGTDSSDERALVSVNQVVFQIPEAGEGEGTLGLSPPPDDVQYDSNSETCPHLKLHSSKKCGIPKKKTAIGKTKSPKTKSATISENFKKLKKSSITAKSTPLSTSDLSRNPQSQTNRDDQQPGD